MAQAAKVQVESTDELVKQFKANQVERFQKNLQRRVERFEEKLGDPKQQQILVLRIKQQNVVSRIEELRENRRAINKQIKALRGNKTRNASTKAK